MKNRIRHYRLFAILVVGLIVSACGAIPAPAVVALSTEATTEAVTAPALVGVTTKSASIADVMPEIVEDNIGASGENNNTVAAPLPVTGLTETEAASLRYMREEEKLAHDVYLTLFEVWGLPIFQNIANSESSHAAAVLGLLERYGLDDPAAGNAVGVFTDPTLQALYE
jgi:hypothetical protein